MSGFVWSLCLVHLMSSCRNYTTYISMPLCWLNVVGFGFSHISPTASAFRFLFDRWTLLPKGKLTYSAIKCRITHTLVLSTREQVVSCGARKGGRKRVPCHPNFLQKSPWTFVLVTRLTDRLKRRVQVQRLPKCRTSVQCTKCRKTSNCRRPCERV